MLKLSKKKCRHALPNQVTCLFQMYKISLRSDKVNAKMKCKYCVSNHVIVICQLFCIWETLQWLWQEYFETRLFAKKSVYFVLQTNVYRLWIYITLIRYYQPLLLYIRVTIHIYIKKLRTYIYVILEFYSDVMIPVYSNKLH